MPRLQQGSIVRATVCDPHGRNWKSRPLVILSSPDDIDSSELIVGAAVSASAAAEKDPPEHYVVLPWNRHRHPRTGLNKPAVVVCNWLVELEKSAVETVIGHVPTAIMEEILRQVSRLRSQQDEN